MEIEKLSAEELAAEQAQLADVKEDEVRASIISEYGFNETDDAERIEKLTAKELEHRKKMSQAIGQKIKWRNEFNKVKDTTKVVPTEVKPTTQPKSDADLTIKDAILIQKANIHEDDIDEVVDFAKYKKLTIAEAIKHDTVQAILAKKAEYRKTAEATSTGATRRVQPKVSDEEILQETLKGNVPKKGTTESERLFWARRGIKK